MLDVTLNEGNIATYKKHKLQEYSVCCKNRFRNDLHFDMLIINILESLWEEINQSVLRWYHTLQGENSLKSVERFDHMMFVCGFQASR
jgi:hypothetical protein